MAKSRALLLDRDGVINVDTKFVGSLDRFEFLPHLFPFLRSVRDLGFRLAVVTNQSGVARGLYQVRDHDAVTAYMLKQLRDENIEIDLTLVCFEHPEGIIPEMTRESYWRKPNPGMVLEAMRLLNSDPARSAFLGDNLRDMHAALAGGITRALWLTAEDVEAPPHIRVVKNYKEALTALG